MGYFNTTNETGDQLKLRYRKAKFQEERIRVYLSAKGREHVWYTPEDIRRLVFDYKIPITSVRRAITNLKDEGFLEKSATANGKGDYNHRVHTWRKAGGSHE